MVVRYLIQCGGCGARIVMRIGATYRQEEPFSFDCPSCSQAIRGVQKQDPDHGKVLGIEIDGAKEIPYGEGGPTPLQENADFKLDFQSGLPTDPEGDPRLTPFIKAFRRHKDLEVMRRLQRLAIFDLVVKDLRRDLTRLIKNYKDEDWIHFAAAVHKHLKDWPVGTPVERIQALYQLLELAMSPVTSSKAHLRIVEYFGTFATSIATSHRRAYFQFLDEIARRHYLRSVHHDALDLVSRFFERADDFRPLLVEWNVESPNRRFPRSLRIEPTTHFHDLKSLYADAYELTSRALTLVTGLINIDERGSHDHYLQHPTLGRRFHPNSMVQFNRFSHGPKLEMIKTHSRFGPWLANSLDPTLRNAINHNRIHLDMRSATVRYAVDPEGQKWKTIPYGEFLARLMRIVIRAHQANRLVKMLYFHWFAAHPKSKTIP